MLKRLFSSVQSLSHVWLFATPWITTRQASLSITISRSSPRLTSIESVMPSSHLILCRPLLLLPPIPPSIRVFSSESTLRMRWPKYWSFQLQHHSLQRNPRAQGREAIELLRFSERRDDRANLCEHTLSFKKREEWPWGWFENGKDSHSHRALPFSRPGCPGPQRWGCSLELKGWHPPRWAWGGRIEPRNNILEL